MNASVTFRHLFHPFRLVRRGRAEIRRSLQARTVVLVVAVSLAVAVIFSLVSTVSVRSSLLDQVSAQAGSDFASQVEQAQRNVDSADTSAGGQYQQLVNDMASSLQSDGASNLVGVYLWSRSTSRHSIMPVSTEPAYTDLISDGMRSAVAAGGEGSVFYQPVALTAGDAARGGPPGAVLGTMLQMPVVGDLELFFIYSYASQQSALEQIQINLILISVLLSVVMGLLMWVVIHRIITPVERVAVAAETLASGDLDARVDVDRNDEIGTLQRSFNEMAVALNQKIDELEAAGASQRRFVSDVSHELRTPVTTMRMASDLLDLRKDTFDATTRRTVELLSGQIGRFQNMLADLLEISRYDAGYAALDLTETDVREPIGEAVDQMRGIAQAKGVPLRVDLPNVQVFARIDARRITRIIRNLLNNAVDFAEGRPVEIRLAANRKAVVVSVRDHGVGMTVDQCAHVFDRFWRADPSRSRTTGGSGLGLSIALADAQLHQGTLAVRSKPGEGTWFLLSLPRDPDRGSVPRADLPVAFAQNAAGAAAEGRIGTTGGADDDDAAGTADEGTRGEMRGETRGTTGSTAGETERMEIVGGFGVADNGFADYRDGREGAGR
ncbi:MtrAB system histidine kinase MtrB [Bifidobacterium amazonense]|uniref:Sensor histidine kinase MtrB n=1 Tax=Bifidobacterium amazonense TaxID=2809027 RepID=A0ABS9VSL7_9BIFI|nr:MtrAB system histidine kinase MtrB [Bifidobacterium amazonense]MCH9275085.1 MtrAB system histidine kinase MtrB [Bifidobacterium amazonense]